MSAENQSLEQSNINRRADSAGEAIFGDKHDQFLQSDEANETSQTPAETSQDLTDPSRRADAVSEALYGDKQGQFEGLDPKAVDPEAKALAEKYEAANLARKKARHAAAILALHETAGRYDWDKDRIEFAKAELERKHA